MSENDKPPAGCYVHHYTVPNGATHEHWRARAFGWLLASEFHAEEDALRALWDIANGSDHLLDEPLVADLEIDQQDANLLPPVLTAAAMTPISGPDGRMRRAANIFCDYDTMTEEELRARLAAMDEQAVAICELFLKYDMVCGGASILPNLEMLLMDFKKVCKKSAAMERALTELVDGLVAGSGHRDDPAIISALQEARTVLRKKDWR